jgi:hypothetical protein
MEKFKPRQISIVYPPNTQIDKFVFFGFTVYYRILADGCLDTIIEETEYCRERFSYFLKCLREEELYLLAEEDFEKFPELDLIITKNAEPFL